MITEKTVNEKKSRFIPIGILAILVLIFLVGLLWNVSDTCMEKKSYPPVGQMVEVFDTRIHVFSIGERRENRPAVVFISGLATPSPTADFYPLWSRLYGEYQAVVLERPGYGWSEATKRERSVENITEEYRSALRQAGIDPPYILVAHSIGGLEAAMFTANYKNDVQGVVLLDCTSPEEMLSYKNSVPLLNRLFPAMRTVGVLRLISAINPGILSNQSAGMRNNFIMLDDYHRTLDKVFVLQKYQDTVMIKEQEMRLINAKTAVENPFPPNLPVSMIVAVQPGDENYPEYHEFMAKQTAWVNQSAKGRLYTLTGRHYIHHYAPDDIRDIIISMATTMDE
jgi:pimeloyl-ACP methyl ester carboxylesterase